MLKIRRSRDRLIFNMRIPILVRRHLYIETALWSVFRLKATLFKTMILHYNECCECRLLMGLVLWYHAISNHNASDTVPPRFTSVFNDIIISKSILKFCCLLLHNKSKLGDLTHRSYAHSVISFFFSRHLRWWLQMPWPRTGSSYVAWVGG